MKVGTYLEEEKPEEALRYINIMNSLFSANGWKLINIPQCLKKRKKKSHDRLNAPSREVPQPIDTGTQNDRINTEESLINDSEGTNNQNNDNNDIVEEDDSAQEDISVLGTLPPPPSPIPEMNPPPMPFDFHSAKEQSKNVFSYVSNSPVTLETPGPSGINSNSRNDNLSQESITSPIPPNQQCALDKSPTKATDNELDMINNAVLALNQGLVSPLSPKGNPPSSDSHDELEDESEDSNKRIKLPPNDKKKRDNTKGNCTMGSTRTRSKKQLG